MGTQVDVLSLPHCQLCAANGIHAIPAHYDAKTIWGPWANMCESCFKQFGVGLGTGKGQRLVIRDA